MGLLSYFKFVVGHGHPSTKDRDINIFLASQFVTPNGTGDCKSSFGASLWEFYAEYWRCRNLPHVKVLVYEHMRQDLGSQLDVIAEFMGLPRPSLELRQKVLELSSMKWMLENDHLFDDHFIGKRLAERGGGSFNTVPKVGNEVKDEGVICTLNQESQALLQRMWKEIVEPVCGHATYADMIAALSTTLHN